MVRPGAIIIGPAYVGPHSVVLEGPPVLVRHEPKRPGPRLSCLTVAF